VDLPALIKQTKTLPQMPAVIQKIMTAMQKDDTNPAEIAEQIAMDQSLSLKVIRLANSPSFSSSRNIANVKEAAARLGLNTLKTLVLTSGITSCIKTPASIDPSGFWHHSFTCAGIAKWICQQSPLYVDQDLAFTCGITHNMGAMVIALCYPEESLLIEQQLNNGAARLELEQKALGFTHADAGAALAEYWRLPAELCTAIRFQYQPEKADSNELLASILHLAGFIYRLKFGDNGKRVDQLFPAKTVAKLGLELTSLLKLSEATDFLDETFQALVA